jgi:hypothetical protein
MEMMKAGVATPLTALIATRGDSVLDSRNDVGGDDARQLRHGALTFLAPDP